MNNKSTIKFFKQIESIEFFFPLEIETDFGIKVKPFNFKKIKGQTGGAEFETIEKCIDIGGV